MRCYAMLVAAVGFALLSSPLPARAQATQDLETLAERCDGGDRRSCAVLLGMVDKWCQEGDRQACQVAANTRAYLSNRGASPDGQRNYGGGSQQYGGGQQRSGFNPGQALPCRFQAGSTSMVSGYLALVPCARMIAASGGRGMWGENQVEVDDNAMVYVNGQQWGLAQNESGTYGTLQQRCQRGDQGACQQYMRQADEYMQRMPGQRR